MKEINEKKKEVKSKFVGGRGLPVDDDKVRTIVSEPTRTKVVREEVVPKRKVEVEELGHLSDNDQVLGDIFGSDADLMEQLGSMDPEEMMEQAAEMLKKPENKKLVQQELKRLVKELKQKQVDAGGDGDIPAEEMKAYMVNPVTGEMEEVSFGDLFSADEIAGDTELSELLGGVFSGSTSDEEDDDEMDDLYDDTFATLDLE